MSWIAWLAFVTLLAARTLPASPPPVSPFAALDIVKLAGRTPGVSPATGLTCPQGPRLRVAGGAPGCVVLQRLKSGQFADGTWGLIVPIGSNGIVPCALVYIWARGEAQFAGTLTAPSGLKASFKAGTIVETVADTKTRFTVTGGRLERLVSR